MALMAIQVSSLDEASTAQKRRAMEFAEATSVSFSYKKLSRVDYLAPFRGPAPSSSWTTTRDEDRGPGSSPSACAGWT